MFRLSSAVSLFAVASATLVFCSAAPLRPLVDDPSAAIQKALSLKSELEAMPAVDDEIIEAVAELSEVDAEQIAGASTFQFWNGGEAGVVCHLPVQDDWAAACVAAVSGESVIGATFLDDKGQAIPEWTYFFSQLQFKALPRLDSALPVSEFDLITEEIAAGDFEESELSAALLQLVSLMQRQAQAFNLPRLRKGSPTAEELEGFAEAYSKVGALKDELQPLLGEAASKFETLANSSAETYRKIASLQREGKMKEAGALSPQITQNCGACHNMEGHNLEGPLSKAIQAKRAELGIGDGFYRVGYDLRVRHDDPEKAQRAALVMRQAVLLAGALVDG